MQISLLFYQLLFLIRFRAFVHLLPLGFSKGGIILNTSFKYFIYCEHMVQAPQHTHFVCVIIPEAIVTKEDELDECFLSLCTT